MDSTTINLVLRRADGAEVHAAIDAEGNVTITVRGAAGMTCRALTAGLEAALGDVRARRMDPRAVAAAAAGGLDATQAADVDRQLVRSGSGGSPCG